MYQSVVARKSLFLARNCTRNQFTHRKEYSTEKKKGMWRKMRPKEQMGLGHCLQPPVGAGGSKGLFLGGS